MNTHIQPSTAAEKAQSWICNYWLPVGFLALLTGMFWVGERSGYHKIFYILFAAPTLLALILKPEKIKQILKNPIVICFLIFSLYTCITLIWSISDSKASQLKQPLYILLLFGGVILCKDSKALTLEKTISAAIIISAISAITSIIYFLYFDANAEDRINGYRALYNPLLSSHVYGMFIAVTLAYLTLKTKNKYIWTTCLLPLLAFIYLSGSRTPLVGITACLVTIAILKPSKRTLLITLLVIISMLLATYLKPTMISQRGLSLRPEIWNLAWLQIQDALWFGHGMDSPMVFWVEPVPYAFADPHNLLLAVWFSGGLVGLLLWAALYSTCAYCIWKNRNNNLVVIAAAAIAFGFAAGLTEGKSFMSRPKEHWFLLWIPFSILAYAIQPNWEQVKAHLKK